MTILHLLRIYLLLCFFVMSSTCYALYEAEISKARNWLVSQQNLDGSWGDLGNNKFINTFESVNALRATGLRNESYYKGITWLENHSSDNIDYIARRALMLIPHGDMVGGDLVNLLDLAQDTSKNGFSGWGTSQKYLQSPIDTALALRAFHVTPVITSNVSTQSALNYLKSAQQDNEGWSIGVSKKTDALSTALIIKSLKEWESVDSTLSNPIQNGLNYLKSKISTNEVVYLQALAAHAAIIAGDSVAAQTWITQLKNSQEPIGSWSNGKVYDTALALRVLAAADGLVLPLKQSTIYIPDAKLRAAINSSLGRGALDRLSCAEMGELTVLDAKNRAITDLTGLECAINLTSLDIRDNNIASTTPIDQLPNLSTLLTGSSGNTLTDEDIPFLPQWALAIMALLLASKKYKSKALGA